jgi:hypothetical protein
MSVRARPLVCVIAIAGCGSTSQIQRRSPVDDPAAGLRLFASLWGEHDDGKLPPVFSALKEKMLLAEVASEFPGEQTVETYPGSRVLHIVPSSPPGVRFKFHFGGWNGDGLFLWLTSAGLVFTGGDATFRALEEALRAKYGPTTVFPDGPPTAWTDARGKSVILVRGEDDTISLTLSTLPEKRHPSLRR